MKKIFIRTLAIFAAFSLLSTPTQASTVTLNLTGKITNASGNQASAFPLNQYIDFSFSYDASLAPTGYAGHYVNSNPFAISFSSNGINYSWNGGSNQIDVTDNEYVGASQFVDQLSMIASNPASATAILGSTPIGIGLFFNDGNEVCTFCGSEIAMLSSDALPTSITAYQSGMLVLDFSNGTGGTTRTDVSFVYADPIPGVPIPGALGLFISGLAALVFPWRRKTSAANM